jgi:hypothetical protein
VVEVESNFRPSRYPPLPRSQTGSPTSLSSGVLIVPVAGGRGHPPELLPFHPPEQSEHDGPRQKGALIPIVAMTRGFPLTPFG